MTRSQTLEDRVRDFVLKKFPIARKNGVKAEEKWLESGMLDSLGILDLVHFLVSEFSIPVSDEELIPENFQSLDAVVNFVRKKSETKR